MDHGCASVKKGRLFFGFHPFCHDFQVHVLCYREDGFHQSGIVRVGGRILDEGFVDLKFMNRQALKINPALKFRLLWKNSK
jgi:hypothetical protein